MRLLIIRHAEPNYEIDSLTEKGWKEAKLLAEGLKNEKIDYIYCSSNGRAMDTASFTCKEKGIEPVICDWLREFNAPNPPANVDENDFIYWDWLPEDYAGIDQLFDPTDWYNHPLMKERHAKERYDEVISQFDNVLEEHGYRYHGHVFDVTNSNTDTIAFFCHFGLGCVLNAHLLGCSPFALWHHSCALASSVTTYYSEERRQGIGQFRMIEFGNLDHLRRQNEEPSFAARFAEIYADHTKRH